MATSSCRINLQRCLFVHCFKSLDSSLTSVLISIFTIMRLEAFALAAISALVSASSDLYEMDLGAMNSHEFSKRDIPCNIGDPGTNSALAQSAIAAIDPGRTFGISFPNGKTSFDSCVHTSIAGDNNDQLCCEVSRAEGQGPQGTASVVVVRLLTNNFGFKAARGQGVNGISRTGAQIQAIAGEIVTRCSASTKVPDDFSGRFDLDPFTQVHINGATCG